MPVESSARPNLIAELILLMNGESNAAIQDAARHDQLGSSDAAPTDAQIDGDATSSWLKAEVV